MPTGDIAMFEEMKARNLYRRVELGDGHVKYDPVQQWQPIETAPKNHILLCGFFNSLGKWRSMHAQWRDDLPQHDMAEAEDEPAEAGWYEGSLEAEMLFPVRPTHWMYLPAPPERKSVSTEQRT